MDISDKENDLVLVQAKRNLEALLNYGGIFVDGQFSNKHISMAFEQGDPTDEIAHMRRLASAFTDLANAFEKKDSLVCSN